VDGVQRFVLAVGSVVVLVGLGAIVWRELLAPVEPPPQGRIRLAVEVLVPVVGALLLLVWLWVR
jgi:hypothetical protein